MKKVVLVDGLRSPFIKYNTLFKDLPAHLLGAQVLKGLVQKYNLRSSEIDEVIVGNVVQPAEATNIARNIALFAGLDEAIPAFSVQRNCASGMQAVADAWYRIQMGHGSTYLTGGVESMSQIPFLFNAKAKDWFLQFARQRSPFQKLRHLLKFRMHFLKPVIGLQLGLTDGFCGKNMGQVTEQTVRAFKISRLEQDQFALQSHLKAARAQEQGYFKDEIFPVKVLSDTKPVDQDNGIRFNQTLEALQKLKPVFDSKGTITAGNASQITDGSALLLIMEEEKAKAMGFKPLVRLKAFAFAALHPEKMGLGPAWAINKLFREQKMRFKDVGLMEINEAFAAQVLANVKIFDSKTLSEQYLDQYWGSFNPDLMNVNGGAIALGHPVGASGARLLLTLAKEMKRRRVELGLASLCVGGGQGAAFLLENLNS